LLYTQKSGTHVYVPLPPFVMSLVRAIKVRHGQYLFTGPESLRMQTPSDLHRTRMNTSPIARSGPSNKSRPTAIYKSDVTPGASADRVLVHVDGEGPRAAH